MKNVIVLFALLCALSVSTLGQSLPPLTVSEVDLSPRKRGINTLIVTNGTLTISGTTATINIIGAGGALAAPGGNGIVVHTGAGITTNRTLTAGAGISVADGTGVSGNPTVTWDSSTFVNNITLWDSANASRTLTAGLSGATDPVLTFANASIATSVPLTIPVGSLGAPGLVFAGSPSAGIYSAAAGNLDVAANGAFIFRVSNGSGVSLESGSALNWSDTGGNPGATKDTGLSRVSAGVVGVGTGASASIAGTLRALKLQAVESGALITVGGFPALLTLQTTNVSTYWNLAYTNVAGTHRWVNYLSNTGDIIFDAYNTSDVFSGEIKLYSSGGLGLGSDLLSVAAASGSLGTAANAFKYVFFAGDSGTPGSNNYKLTGTATGARVVTFPDASITVARTDAGQTFTGVQAMTSPDVTTSLTTPSTTFALINATATTINFGGAATTLNMAGGSGAVISLGGAANAANLRFLEPSGSGTNYTQIKAQAQAGDITYTLPPANVTNGFLKNDGSGGLVWETISSTPAWNAITDPTGNLALTMAANTSTFTYNATTSTANLFSLTNGTNDTGTNALVLISTPGASNAKTPFRVNAQGGTASFEVTAAGAPSGRGTDGAPSERFGSGSVALNGGQVFGNGSTANGSGTAVFGASASTAGGSGNTVIGTFAAGGSSTNSTVLGGAASSANFNYAIALGYDAEPTAHNQMAVGSNNANITAIYLGRGFHSSVSDATVIVAPTGGFSTDAIGSELRLQGGNSTGAAAPGIISFYTGTVAASSGTKQTLSERARFDGAGNLGLGVTAFGTSAAKVIGIGNGTAPSTSPADMFQLWSADSAAGDANAFARNEAGEINRLTGLAARNSSAFAKTSDTTLANITGLTRNVEASRVYAFVAELSTTSAATGGVKFAVSGTATATAIDYEGILIEGVTVTAKTRATALDTTVCAATAVTVATCRIRGTIVVNAAGTLTIQFAQNASDGGASTVLVNQSLQLIPIS